MTSHSLSLSNPNLGKLEEIEEKSLKSVLNRNLQFLPNSKKYPDMAVTHQQQPQEGQINGGAEPLIASTKPLAENTFSKCQRRPSVRLGEIGDQPVSALMKVGKASNKASRTRPLTNLSVFDGGEERENVDNLAIGSWKIKGSKSKRPRTNWASRIDEGVGNNLDGQDGFVRDSENEQSPAHSVENEKDLKFRVRTSFGDDDGVELDGPSDNGGGQSARRWGRDEGVKVWLNGLELGRYWPVFRCMKWMKKFCHCSHWRISKIWELMLWAPGGRCFVQFRSLMKRFLECKVEDFVICMMALGSQLGG